MSIYFNICLSLSGSFEGLRWLELWRSHVWGLVKKIYCYIGCWLWCSLIVVHLRKYFILFLICIFLWHRILSQLHFSQHFKMWCQCPLFNIVLYASSAVFPMFLLLCLFFLLVIFLWLIVWNNELSCTF